MKRSENTQRRFAAAAAAMVLSIMGSTAHAGDAIGEVDTAFKLIGANHKIVVEAFDDPDVQGVACFVSRAKTGGVTGWVGLAEDKAEASIACRQIGPIAFPKAIPKQAEVFSERMSPLFKRLRIVRMVDAKRHALIYMTYSDKAIDGSPQNSVTAVPYGDAQLKLR